MTCSQGIYYMHLNNMPNENFTENLFCSPSPKPAYYFWNNTKNEDNLYNVTVCKMEQFTRSRRIELLCKQVMLSDINCDDTYADDEHDAQESTNSPATWYNASTTHFFVSISPSTEAPSSSHSLVKLAATLDDNNNKLFWIVIGIIIILITVIVHFIVCVCRYSGLCETATRFCRQSKDTPIDGVEGEDRLTFITCIWLINI
jgi:hypothetical protein